MRAKKYRRLVLIDLLLLEILLFVILNKAFGNYFLSISSGKFIFCSLYILRALIALHAGWCTIKYLYFSLVKADRPVRYSNLKLSVITILAVAFFCEAIFMFVPQSQGNTQFGLATLPWTFYYEGNRNEKQYRDKNLEGRLNNGKKKIFFLGDSFTYGSGIKDPADRFSDLVSKGISDKYEVFNLGKGNSDTRNEFIRLVQFGSAPDILVLQYYFNDIAEAIPQEQRSPSVVLKAGALLSRTSYFLNFIAVNMAKFTPAFQSNDFRKKMADSYKDEAQLKAHVNDLQQIINYCKLNKTKMYVLFIPDMRDVAFAEKNCYPAIRTYLDAQKIPFFGIYDEIKDMSVNERVVSDVDAHANEQVQRIIAQRIFKNLGELKN